MFGPRQTGKTRLVNASYAEDRLRTYELLKTDEYMRLAAHPALFRQEVQALSSKITHVFVDEVQRLPALLNEVHLLIESGVPQRFILTGSSARKLKRSQANLLAGRAWTLRLHPLTHVEIGETFSLEKALSAGTLPRIYLEPDSHAAQQFLRSYVETYLKEEIEAEAILRNTGVFLRFLLQASHENGKLLNYASIARETGTTHPTVKEYYKILEDTLLGVFLLPFHKSPRKRLGQHPKFYFFDTGVLRALQKKLTLELQSGTFEYGQLFETWMITETFRLCSYLEKDFEFSYLRTERGAEVDLVIDTPKGKRIAVEFKSSANPSPADCRAGFRAIRELDKNIRALCVCTAPHARHVEDFDLLPWRDYFQWLQAE